MPSEKGAIGEDDVICQVRIMPDMAVHHEKIVGTDHGLFRELV